MKILVIGAGLMGPAAVHNAISDQEVTQVTLVDRDPAQLEVAGQQLARFPGAGKLTTTTLDVSNQAAAQALFGQYDAILAALPHGISIQAIRAALLAGVPLVDLSRPEATQLYALRSEVNEYNGLVVLGGGLEPGLTEIMARHLAEQLDNARELHIRCGGITTVPSGPLGYKIVFGGRHLPIRERKGHVLVDGELEQVYRYTDVERLHFEGVGELEAWNENFMPWLLDLAALKSLEQGTQKTVRWPGYAARVNVLRELGLLSQQPLEVDGVTVRPKHVVDAVLAPHVTFGPDDLDITVFRVEVLGEKNGRPHRCRAEMVDRYDEALGFTSMARTTAYTGMILARMIARGEISGSGLLAPETLVHGAHFDRLLDELAALGIRFEVHIEAVEPAGG